MFLNAKGEVDFDKVEERWKELADIKVSLAAKYWTAETANKARSLPSDEQHRLLDVLMGGLCNEDSGVGAYATRPEDYDNFSFFLEPLIREYHKI